MGLSATALAAASTETFDTRVSGTTTPFETSKPVTIDVTPHDPAKIYYVVVDWEDTTFMYDFDGAPTWKPEDHTYDPISTAHWDKTSANIKVTNHSNAAVTVTSLFSNGLTTIKKYDVTGDLTNSSINLPTGEGLDWGTAANGTTTLNISGTPNVTGQFILDTITVTISPTP